MLPVPIFYGILIVTCVYAQLRGGAPERVGAAIFASAAILSTVAISAGAHRYVSIEFGVLAVDVAMLIALVVLALRAERFWPLWVTALHIIGLAGHAVKAADPAVMRLGYAFALAVWSYPMLALLAIGTWNHQRRLKRDGADASWSSSCGPLPATPPPPPTGSSKNSAA